MNVLIINKYHYLRGGSETAYFNLSKIFKEKGHNVINFSMKDERNYPSEFKNYFVKNRDSKGNLFKKIEMIYNLNYSKEAYNKLRKLILDTNPNFAILNLVHKELSMSVVQCLHDFNIPFFWVVHDLVFVCPNCTMLDNNGNICELCKNGNFKNCLSKRCQGGSFFKSLIAYNEAKFIKKHKFYDLVDCFITPSIFYRNLLENSTYINNKIVYIPNYSDLKPHEQEFKKGDYFLYYGRISKEKGLLNLLNSFKFINSKLYIVGKGPQLDELIEFSKKNKMEEKVYFLGFKKGHDLFDLIKNSLAVIMPSIWYENCPYSAIESLSFAKPLIVSNNGGLPEFISNNGYVFNDCNELCNILEKFVSISSNDYIKMCNNSLKLYKAKYYKNDYVDKIIQLYRNIRKD